MMEVGRMKMSDIKFKIVEELGKLSKRLDKRSKSYFMEWSST